LGDPDATSDEYWLLLKTLYGLCWSPRHWYDKIDAILCSLGLTPSSYDPCLYSGFIQDPNNPSQSLSTKPLSLGLYFDDFVYFSEDPVVEALFERLLCKQITVNFMGLVEWFLGIHFAWQITKSTVDVHMNQSGFAANLVEQYFCDKWDHTPDATPYRSRVPIDSIAPCTNADNSPAQLRRTEAYQSLIGSIGWLASATHPDIAPVHSFLSSYSNKPAPGHMKEVLYALHYIHSTYDYGITFTSSTTSPIHTYIYFPDPLGVEAYTDAIPPSESNCAPLTTHSNACWGSQLGSAVRDGTLLPLFKFQSISGGIVFRQGGPLPWTAICQDQTALISEEPEIRATNDTAKSIMGMRHLAESVQSNSGYDISDTVAPSSLYNDNAACIQWAHNMTSKKIQHMELCKNTVREWVRDGTITACHVKGRVNPADIFLKEIRDGAHFWRLRDSFMCHLSDFLHQ
jgi:hypothetical protein